ncbi:hypothetical protein C9427_03480 [Mesorhizobium helmanticense]|uniref:Peptidoglycan binding-like domain-containing protein n=1 Tax=Mesorhizobium helmanticense TaxID=1776423 RepID=A0A2T4J1H6_9HYPH|nr:hypothetical protein C9427_03480 [Mesorhizobium helmanticense]
MSPNYGRWKQVGRRVTLALCALLAAMLPRTVQGGMLSTALPVELEIRAYHLEFTPDGNNLILIEGPTDRVVLYDLATASIKFSTQVPHNVSDTTFSSGGDYVFLIGQDSKAGNTAVSRMSLEDGIVRTVAFDRQLDRPSIAVGPDDRLFVSRYLAGTLKQVPIELFDTGLGDSPIPFDIDRGGNELLIKAAPVAGIESVPGERILFVSHAFERAVTAIDMQTGGSIDQLKLDGKMVDEKEPALHLVATFSGQSDSVVIGDSSGERLLIADVDEAFSSFDIIQVVDLKAMHRASDAVLRKSPLLIAADAEQNAILVGSENSTEVLVYSRSTRSLEVQNTLLLPFRPSALDVSPKGDTAAFLDAASGRLIIQDDPTGRGVAQPVDQEMERVREVQRQLSELGYPVGLVDGLYGTQTSTAIALFQKQQGLKVTGTLDDEVLATLDQVVAHQKGNTTTQGANKDFVVVQAVINPVLQPRNVGDPIGYCAGDERCSSLAEVAESFLKLPPGTVAAALAAVPRVSREGEEGRYTIELPAGYQYCRSKIRTSSVVPATGDRASVMSASSFQNGVHVYTWTPKRGIVEGRSWVEADYTIYGVRDDLAEKRRIEGKCRPHGKQLIGCRGARGTNKGQPSCGTVED